MTKMKWKQAFQKAELEIPGRNIRPQGCLMITNALLKNKSLVKIDFAHNHLGDEGAVHFAQLLKVNESLRTVNLACNEITDVGGIALASAFIPTANPSGQPSQWNRNVWHFNLSGNLLKEDTLVAFSNAITCNTDFTELDLTNNLIGPQGTKVLARTMTRNNMCGIKLSTNDLRDEGVAYLCDAWKRYGSKGTQRHLDLSRNNLGQNAGEHLGVLLQGNEFVMEVNLQENTLGTKGIRSMMGQLLINPSACLRVLNVFDNCIGDEAAEDIAKYIALDTTLEILDISTNNIGEKGGLAIFNALLRNNKMTMLLASNNRFGEGRSPAQFVDLISNRLRTTKTLRLIDVKKNSWSDEVMKHLSNIKEIPVVTFNNPEKEGKQESFEPRCEGEDRAEEVTREQLLEKLASLEQTILDDELKFSMKGKKGKGKRGSSATKKA